MNNLPPNWYPDPHEPGSERYWDGKRFAGRARRTQAPTATWQGISGTRPPGPAGPTTWQDNLRPVATWARSHKVITVVIVLFLIGLVGSALEDADPPPDKAPAAAADVPTETTTEEPVEEPTEEPTETVSEEPVAAEEPLTDEDLWRAAYQDNERRIFRALARTFPAYQHPSDATNESVSTCEEIQAGDPLHERSTRATTRWSAFQSVPSAAQVAVILDLTVANVCPTLADVHGGQVAEKETADRQAAAAEARRQQRAQAREERRQERARERAERQAQQEQEPVNVYYANCSEVEAAGAAPIYAGDPGYSGDLDADGDGVACEQ